MNPAEPLRTALGRLPAADRLSGALLAGGALAFTLLLAPRWVDDPDLAHGIFMPVIFVLLLREARRQGRQRFLAPAPARAAAAALAAAGLVILALAGMYAAALEWTSELVDFLLAASLVALLGAGLALAARSRTRLVPLNWNSAVAVGLWLLCAPLPPGSYTRLSQGLQLWVSTAVVDALQVLGVAAHRLGNIIELAKGTVGVADACSGVRSLLSCVYAALFFSATFTRRPLSRALLIAAAAPLALAMNFVRALLLTLLVDRGVVIEGAWHDLTGFAVLGVTAALLVGLAAGLDRGLAPPAAGPPPVPPALAAGAPPRDGWFAGALLLAAALAALFAAATHPNPPRNAATPDLARILPSGPPHWRVVPGTDLAKSINLLGAARLAQATYLRDDGGPPLQLTFSLAYWQPGQVSVSLVAEHTPDACWPAAGWQERALPHAEAGLQVAGRTLAPPEARLFTFGEFPEHIWFWHLYNGRPIPYQNPYSLRELLDLAWRYGFRHDGDQLFVSVASNRPWPEIAREPVVQEFFARLRPLGL
jgi:exosortase